MPNPESKIVAVQQGTLDYLNSRQQIIDLNLKQPADWFSGKPQQASSSMPANPYLQCPRLLLVQEQLGLEAVSGSGGLRDKFNLNFSVFYYRKQTPGQNHQKLIALDIDAIITAFTYDLLYPHTLGAPSIPGYQLTKATPSIGTFYPDLWDEFKDPNLTCSVAGINFATEGYISAY